jgi:hypothetical protein
VVGFAHPVIKNQNLLLGPDCEKYLTKSPKAPPDIDKWMNADSPGKKTVVLGGNLHSLPFSSSQQLLPLPLQLQYCDGQPQEKVLKYAVFAWGACSVVLLLSAFKYGVVCISAGILMSSVFALLFLAMSRVTMATTVASSIFLFAMTSTIALEGRIRAVFVCTTG